MAFITSSSLSNTVAPAILNIMDMENEAAIQASLRRTQLYTTMTSNTATEEVLNLGAISPDSWLTYQKTGEPGRAGMIEDFKTTFAHKDYPLNIEIPKNLIADNNIPMVEHIAQGVRDSLERRMEEDAASIFINAFTASAPYLLADGVALCSNSHPLSPADSSTTQDNLDTVAFSYAQLKAARVAMKKFTDHNNRRMGFMADLVLMPVDLHDEAIEIINAEGKPKTADNDANAVSGTTFFDWFALDSDTNDWFVIDSNAMKRSLIWFDRSSEMSLDPIYQDTMKVIYQWKARYSFGATDWRWIYGHQVA